MSDNVMVMLVLHDLNRYETYVNPYDISAIYRTSPDGTGATLGLNGGWLQVVESPGAVLYMLQTLPAS